MYIILVEDDPHVRQLYKLELEDSGYEVFVVEDEKELFKAMEEKHPSLVVLDIVLEGRVIGLDLLLKLRQSCPDMPIILHSAYDAFAGDPRAMAAADYYVIKSYDTSELLRKIHQAMEAFIP